MALTQELINAIQTSFDINDSKQNAEIRAAFQALLDSGAGAYKSYIVTLNQSGTNAPVETILTNSLSGTPTWSYDFPGAYTLTLAGEFPDSSKVVIIGGLGITDYLYGYEYQDADGLSFVTTDVSTLGGLDDGYVDYNIEIRVYE